MRSKRSYYSDKIVLFRVVLLMMDNTFRVFLVRKAAEKYEAYKSSMNETCDVLFEGQRLTQLEAPTHDEVCDAIMRSPLKAF